MFARCRISIDYERYAVIAITSIYGVDILQDNVDECRNRMFNIFDHEYTANCKEDANDETRKAVRYILHCNILCGDVLTMKTTAGEPIIFAEWSAVNTCLIKRRDFRLDKLLEANVENDLQGDLFGDIALYKRDDTGARIPVSIREFPPIHYRKVQLHE